MNQSDGIDERALDLIASRVVEALKDELAQLAAGGERTVKESALTVDDVAKRLDVSRSTVYAHWREWGGYKLGAGDKSAIRFRASSLPTRPSKTSQPTVTPNARPRRARRGRRARVVLLGKPRLGTALDVDLTVLDSGAANSVNSAPSFDAADA